MKRIAVALSALLAIAWNGAGESFDPALAVHELPLAVFEQCASKNGGDCLTDGTPVRHWIGRSRQGNVFLLSPSTCADAARCPHWLVEKGTDGVAVLLSVVGELRLTASAEHPYPAVSSRTIEQKGRSLHVRYEWNGSAYGLVESRIVYQIDGEECGSEQRCRALAEEAMRHNNPHRAVRILETLYPQSWI